MGLRDREDLGALASLYGVQGSYTNQAGRRVRVRTHAVLATLRALGAPVASAGDVPEAVRARRLELLRREMEPVVVAWDGRMPAVRIRLPAREVRRRAGVTVHAEDGGGSTAGRAELRPLAATNAERARLVELSVGFEPSLAGELARLPFGYHSLRLDVGARELRTLVVSAPRTARDSEPGLWGVFVPLYALRARDGWGVGDLGDLLELTRWVGGLGGSLVATLPLLPSFLSGPVFEPSPYSPVSRLFWNELYADVEADSAGGRARGRRFQADLARLRASPLVDYAAVMRAKRAVLETLARRSDQVRVSPRVADYAAFRANTERRGATWWTWPQAERAGRLPRFGGDPDAYRYHAFAQELMASQMASTAHGSSEAGGGLYFDLPVGVHPGGYDVWREREAFILDASAGAPPDLFFSEGQDWGFPPTHPDGDRTNGYRYFRATIQHLFRHASVARIDHVMGLHRMFVVPRGMSPADGAYVRFRPEELYAIVALESRRHGTVVVGEDLGTVPRPVRSAMAAHGVHRSYVMQFDANPDPRRAIPPPPERSLAGLNTHDTPTFAGWWRGLDVDLRLRQGWMAPGPARDELAQRSRIREAVIAYLRGRGRLPSGSRAPSVGAVLRGVLSELAASDARIVLAALEDLWLEPHPQNVPGTTDAFPNWRRPARVRLEDLLGTPSVTGPLKQIERERAARRSPPEGREAGAGGRGYA